MDNIRIAVCDDNVEFLDLIEQKIQSISNNIIIETYTEGNELIKQKVMMQFF